MTTHNRQQFQGLDTDYCRGKASQMRGQSEQMNGLMGNIQGMLDGVVWQGGNAERFVDNWGSTLRPKMAESSTEMDHRGRELRKRADLQDEASA
ncbi:hypothetical protein [Nakamurella lactea]|uniref:hypothetical protein n=1 Tax=Nakamurella lactea TaxID=459515 RepID=UPI000491FAF4|nr:hypothetical protein [Nakamurella lactea]